MAIALLAAALLVVATAAAWGWLRHAPAPPTARFAITLPEGTSRPVGSDITVSRDGQVLIFPGVDSSGTQQLWLKRAGDLVAAPIPGTEQGWGPFLSPDGSQLGFFRSVPHGMSVVALPGGSPRVIADTQVGSGGGTWATDGFIYFDASQHGIQRIRPDGSGREAVLDLDSAQQVTGFAWPAVLPGNRVLIARVRHGGNSPQDFEIVASRIGSNASSPLTKGVLARSYGDHLFVVSADGILRSWKLDPGAPALKGIATVVATGLRVTGAYAGVDLAVDARGTLYYGAGRTSVGSLLEWVDSSGHREPVDSTWQVPWQIVWSSLSPDGRRAMVAHYTGRRLTLWIKQLPVGPMTPFAAESLLGNDLSWVNASWTPDGKSVLTSVSRDGGAAIYRQRADGLGAPTLVVADHRILLWPEESRDGRWLVAGRRDSTAPPDIVAMQLGRDTVLRPLIATPAAEGEPALSPDGHWLAYVSGKSGRNEVYVQPFPDVNGGIWQV
ncbi:MAG TPA: hypothetical protein VNH46_03290, partial [Gemmatimonadales bacterium]|nr:hypothetical protein [Gemmatimonadales bacterium]